MHFFCYLEITFALFVEPLLTCFSAAAEIGKDTVSVITCVSWSGLGGNLEPTNAKTHLVCRWGRRRSVVLSVWWLELEWRCETASRRVYCALPPPAASPARWRLATPHRLPPPPPSSLWYGSGSSGILLQDLEVWTPQDRYRKSDFQPQLVYASRSAWN